VVGTLHDRIEEIPTDTLLRMGKQAGQLPLKTVHKLAQLGDGLGEVVKKLVK
jgi:hypothetical protein